MFRAAAASQVSQDERQQSGPSNNPKKTGRSDNDDSAVTVAVIHHRSRLRPNRRLRWPDPPALPTLSKSASRNKRKTPAVFPGRPRSFTTANGDRSLIRALGLKSARS
jgi:hypothetical protein